MKTFANILRIVIAVGLYMLWALQHLYLAISGNAQVYESFFDASYLPVYTWAWRTIGEPLFPWIAVLVVAFEYALGFMMLSRGQTARLGQWAGFVWNLLLVPFPWGYANVILAAAHLWLATRTFKRSIIPLPSGRTAAPLRRTSHG